MTKVMIYGMCGMDNLGDDLMFGAVTSRLKQAHIDFTLIKRNRWDSYFEMESAPQMVIPSIYSTVVSQIYSRLHGHGNFSISDAIMRISKKRLTNQFRNYSAIIFIGGGYLTSNLSVMDCNELQNILSLCECAKSAGRKIIFSGITLGPFNFHDQAESLVRKILTLADLLTVREAYSLDIANKLDLNARLTGDNIFSYERKNLESTDRTEPYVLVTVKAHHEQKMDLNLRIEAIIKICSRQAKKVIFVPYRSDEDSEEYRLNLEVMKILGDSGINSELFVPRSISEFFNLMNGAELIIGSAYHCVATAAFLHKPLYTWYAGRYYHYKIGGVIDLMGGHVNEEHNTGLLQVDNWNLAKRESAVENVLDEWHNIIRVTNDVKL